jgi:outer membrane immunogenic protein
MIKLIAISAIIALPLVANAADMPITTLSQPLTSTPPIYNWTGFYVGLYAGGMFQGGNLNLATTTGDDAAINPHLAGSSFIGGGLLGYNYQMGATVVGVEGDIGFNNAKSTVVSANPAYSLSEWYANNTLTEHITGHVRARLGWASGPMLIYSSAGVALSGVKVDVVGICGSPPYYYGTGSHERVGMSLGAGAEYALTHTVILRGEYIYDNYGRQSVDVGSGWQNRKINAQNQTMRTGISYKF